MNIYVNYWHNSFRSRSIEKTRVSLRYDPTDAGIAYAYVRGQWVRCISQYYSIFQGRSEREIQLATQELRQQHKKHGQRFTITAKALADFLEGTQATESILLQRLKDGEAKDILSTISVSSNEEMELESTQKTRSVVSETEPNQEQKPEEIKPTSSSHTDEVHLKSSSNHNGIEQQKKIPRARKKVRRNGSQSDRLKVSHSHEGVLHENEGTEANP